MSRERVCKLKWVEFTTKINEIFLRLCRDFVDDFQLFFLTLAALDSRSSTDQSWERAVKLVEQSYREDEEVWAEDYDDKLEYFHGFTLTAVPGATFTNVEYSYGVLETSCERTHENRTHRAAAAAMLL